MKYFNQCVILILDLLIVIVIFGCVTVEARSKQFEQQMLDYHNIYRARHHVSPLKLSYALSDYSYEWANVSKLDYSLKIFNVKTTDKSIKWIICFSPVSLNVFLAKYVQITISRGDSNV